MQQSVLEVRHLRLVAAIVDQGSLTRASARLNLTQSALSHQLIELEQRLGTPLFHRVNKRMSPTEAGERVLATARRVLEELSETEQELYLFATDRRGTIRLTTQCYTVYHWLPTVRRSSRSTRAWPSGSRSTPRRRRSRRCWTANSTSRS
jgi:LysR family transcriptional regulator for metE and metH